MEYLEYICPIVCFVVCVLHSIIESIIMSKQNKKIDKICEKCLQPVQEDTDHTCDPQLLNALEVQAEIVSQFIASLRGDK